MKEESNFTAWEGCVSVKCSCCKENTVSYLFCKENIEFIICHSCFKKISKIKLTKKDKDLLRLEKNVVKK